MIPVAAPERAEDGADGPDQPSAPRPWLKAVRIGLLFWGLSHLVLLAVWVLSGPIDGLPTRASLNGFIRWDALNYLHIAQHGYADTGPPAFRGKDSVSPYGAQWPVWLPLYPMTVRYADLVLPGDARFALLAVSDLAALGLFIVLYRLLDHEFEDVLAERTILFIAAFPTAFFLFTGYNMSLFLLLAVTTLYAARRGHWWLVAVAGALASATRTAGVLLVAPVAYEYLRQRGFRLRAIRFDVLFIALVPAGLVAYMIFLGVVHDDPLAFNHQQVYWGREHTVPPWTTFAMQLREIFAQKQQLSAASLFRVMDLAVAVAAIVLLVLAAVGPWKLRRDQLYLVIFGALGLLLILVSPLERAAYGPLQSMSRYALEAVPAFVVLARICRNRFAERAYLILMLSAQAALLLTYLRYKWAG